MCPSEVNTFPRVLDGGAHAGLAVPQLESHSMRSSEVNTFPHILDGGAHAGLSMPPSRTRGNLRGNVLISLGRMMRL